MINNQTSSSDISAKSSHTMSIDRRKTASISGVADVLSFHETEIALKIDSGLMYIAGSSLHISKLLLEEGRLDVDGHIDSIVYETPRKSAKRLFYRKWFGK